MEAAIRFNQNSLPGTEQLFLKIDVADRSFALNKIKAVKKGVVAYDVIGSATKLPRYRAFDWHPTIPSLVALGQTDGDAGIADLSNNEIALKTPAKGTRPCNAIALNTGNLLAVGLEKKSTDSCLNIWDLNQRLPTTDRTASSIDHGQLVPLHGLAGGDSVTSLKFFQDQPKLLAVGVKSHFVRLYDLRDQASASGSVLQFATHCVNNLAIDPVNEHSFASCFPSNNTQIMLWDRRMTSRTHVAHTGFGQPLYQNKKRLEPSLQLHDVIDQPGTIWALRFCKTRPGHLGALSSSGQVRIFDFTTDQSGTRKQGSVVRDWRRAEPEAVSLRSVRSASNAFFNTPAMDEMERIVSFDFTTYETRAGLPKMMALTLDGRVLAQNLEPDPQPRCIPSTSSQLYTIKNNKPSTRRQVEKVERLLLQDVDRQRRRCVDGYRLDVSTNLQVVQDALPVLKLWSWIKHVDSISGQGAMMQDGLNFSYLGIFALWMEEIDMKHRSTKTSSYPNHDISSSVTALARKLNLSRGRGCTTEYPHHRALCLYVSGMPCSYEDLKSRSEGLTAHGKSTEAAAICAFAGEEKLAQQALRSKGVSQSHKMLAMALAGNRYRRRESHKPERAESDDPHGDDWQDTISSLVEDLTDPFARAILSYVKLGSWDDAVKNAELPLEYRVNIALRHFDDAKLTRYIDQITDDVVTRGDIEGTFLTGLGTTQAITLLMNYARNMNDLQTAALATAFAGLTDRFLGPDDEQTRQLSTVRDSYRRQMRSWALKFEKAKFDIAVSRSIRDNSGQAPHARPKEQIKLICNHCSQSLSQFGHDQQVNEGKVNLSGTKGNKSTPERAAQVGIVCPKCGQHLPRCGVCDLWLGVPDDSYSKWYKPPQRGGVGIDLSASLTGSAITTIGPGHGTPSITVSTPKGGAKTEKLDRASAPEIAVEEADGDVASQEKERKWFEAMHRFTIFCLKCMHGFHAEHAKQWFEGSVDHGGHRYCPVPTCDCLCNG